MQLTARYNMCTFKQTKKLRDIFSLFKTSEKQQQTPFEKHLPKIVNDKRQRRHSQQA